MSQLYASSALVLVLFIPVAARFAPLCNLPLHQVQGVFVLDSRLHLVVDDHFYSFPFTADYINSKLAMVAFFAQSTSTDHPLGPHHWKADVDLAVVVERLGGTYKSKAYQLLALTQFESAKTATGDRCQFAHLIFKNSSHRQVHLLVNQTARSILEAESSQLDGRYAFIGDGDHREYVIRSAGRDSTVFVPGPVVASEGKGPQLNILPSKTASFPLNETFYGTVVDGNQVFFSSSPPAGTALVTDPANTFGFIFDDTVHIWDFASRQVYLFSHPPEGELSKLGSNGAKLRTEPMSTYFICSRSAWDIKVQSEKHEDNNSTGTWHPPNPTTLDDGFKWWWLVGLLISLPVLLAIAIAFGVFIFYRFRRPPLRSKSRRRKKRMTQSTTSRQLRSHAFRAPTSLSSSPGSSDMDLTRLKNIRAQSSSLGSDGGSRKNLFVAKLPFNKEAAEVSSISRSATADKTDKSRQCKPTMSSMLASEQRATSHKSWTGRGSAFSDMTTTSAFPDASKVPPAPVAKTLAPTPAAKKTTDRGSQPGSQTQLVHNKKSPSIV